MIDDDVWCVCVWCLMLLLFCVCVRMFVLCFLMLFDVLLLCLGLWMMMNYL